MKLDTYRPDIDGLRAIAVLSVLIFHAFPSHLPGGFVGVDLFFVISGFLITGIIRNQKSRETFCLWQFYERRIRRIFPALVVVLAFTYFCGWLFLLPAEFAQLGTNVIAGAASFANVSLWLQAGYFDIEATKKPLLHLWSLGVEEQFYILWPLLLIVATRFRNGPIVIIATVGLASLVLNLALVHRYPEATFYLPFTRAWELLAGSFLTYSRLEAKRFSNVASLAGLALIVFAIAQFSDKSPFPGWRAILPVAGTALLISAPSSILNRWVLGSSACVSVGLISYPLYLWHWPLLVYGREITDFNDTKRGIVLIISFGLAWATYRFIETPIRTGRYGRSKVAILTGALAAVAIAAALTVRDEGTPSRFPPEMRSILQTSVQAQRWRRHECILLDDDSNFADTCVDEGAGPLLFVWGDSTAAALTPGLRDLQRKRQFRLAQFTVSSCSPLIADIDGPHCQEMNRKVLAAIERTNPDIVLLEASWYPGPHHLDGLVAAINKLKELGVKRIVVLGRVPVWTGGLPRNILNEYRLNFHNIPTRIRRPEKDKWYDAKMRERIGPLGATFVSAWDAMCDVEDGCIVRLPDASGKMDVSATDTVHLSEAGSAYLIDAIANQLLPP